MKNNHRISQNKARKGWLFCIPFIIGFLFFFLVPLLQTALMSFHNISARNMIPVGWKHYYDIFFTNAEYVPKVKESLTDLLINFPCILIFSFFISNILNHKFAGRTAARAVFFLPVIIYSGVLALMSSNQIQDVTVSQISAEASSAESGIFQITEVISGLVSTIKIDKSIIDFVVSAVERVQDITISSGVQILVFLSGLQTISPSLYEASSMEGASSWENFWKITFPMISPMILVNAVYTIIDCMTDTANPVIRFLYYESSVYGRHGPAAAMNFIYFIIISVILSVFVKVVSRFVFYEER